MTASLVASVKLEREQIEQLARALRVPVLVDESGAALFRRCLEVATCPAELRARVLLPPPLRMVGMGGRGEPNAAAGGAEGPSDAASPAC